MAEVIEVIKNNTVIERVERGSSVIEVLKGAKGDRANIRPATTWHDVFDGVRYGTSVPSSKAVVSLTANVFDGYVSATGKTYHPAAMLNFAECNWNAQTLGPLGSAFLNYSKGNSTGTAFDFTTMFEGQYFLIAAWKAAGILQDWRLWIDDQEVTEWYRGSRATGVLQTGKPIIDYTGADSTIGALNINFVNRGLYKIRCAGTVISGTTGLIAINAEGKCHMPKKQRVLGIISDSWYDTIATHTSLNGATELTARMGWKQWNMAIGGSGFSNPQNLTTNFQFKGDAVFASLAKAPPLDLLLVNGSANDLAYPNETVIQDMKDFFNRFRSVRPNTPIVWQGLEPVGYFENQWTSAYIIARENMLAEVALADPSVVGVIRPALEDWITGTGNTTVPNGTGNQDWITGLDGVHLSKWGTTFNGAMVHQRLSSIPTWRET